MSYFKYDWKIINEIDDVDEFNDIRKLCMSLGKLKLTIKGHLEKTLFLKQGMVDSITNLVSYNTLEFIAVVKGNIYRFVFRPNGSEKNMTGCIALKKLEEECGDLLKPYAVVDNEQVKAIKDMIPKPKINLTNYGELVKHQELHNVFHIDLHSAYPSGLVAVHPEFKEIINKFYKERKTNEEYKAVLNYSIGTMQTLKFPKRKKYPQLALDAITWTNNKLDELTEKLKSAGFSVIGYNTDGIFAQHKDGLLYHDADEGDGLGQWRIDYVYDRIRFKTATAYEFEVNGVYDMRYRGLPERKRQYYWGAIYDLSADSYYLNPVTGLVEVIHEAKIYN